MKFGQATGQQRYRCKSCRRTFIALTGTPFVYLHDKDKLLAHAGCMAEGLTIRKSAQRVGLTVDRAFRWRHTFLAYLQQQKPMVTGVVEADETFFRRSFRDSASAAAYLKERGGVAKMRRRGRRFQTCWRCSAAQGWRMTWCSMACQKRRSCKCGDRP